MKIAGIASGNAASKVSMSKPLDRFEKRIEALMNQKSQITENIASVRSNEKLTEEQKNQRIEMLSIQLQDIEAQIMQLKVEQEESKKEKSSNSKPPAEDSSDTTTKSDVNNALNGLLGMDSRKEDLTQLHSTRRKLKADADRYRSEMKRDGSHTEGDPVMKSKLDKVIEIEGKISRLDLRIGEGFATVKTNPNPKLWGAVPSADPGREQKQEKHDALDRGGSDGKSNNSIDVRA